MNSTAKYFSLVLLVASSMATAQPRQLGIGNVDNSVDGWFGPFEFTTDSDIFAHLTSMEEQGSGVALKLSRSRNPQRLENSIEINGTTGREPVRIIAGDNTGLLFLWANVPQATEDTCLIDGYNATVIKSPAARRGQTILVLTGHRRLTGVNNNPCP